MTMKTRTLKEFMKNLQKSEKTVEKSGHGLSKIKWNSPDYDVNFATKKEAIEWFKTTIKGETK